MTRSTSIDVFHQIQKEGLLGRRQLEVYSALFEAGPMTQVEVVRWLQAKQRDITDHGYTPRFSELRRQGAIYEVQERPCSVTNRNVIEWDVTDNLPVKKSAMETKASRIKLACDMVDEIAGIFVPYKKLEEIKNAIRDI